MLSEGKQNMRRKTWSSLITSDDTDREKRRILPHRDKWLKKTAVTGKRAKGKASLEGGIQERVEVAKNGRDPRRHSPAAGEAERKKTLWY